jgi:transcriptional regulator with XRE-family HTH domain
MRNKLFQEALEQVPEHTNVFIRKYTDIIDRIHNIMEEKELLQRDLANLMDKKESEISKWLKGDYNMTLRTIAKIEAALGEDIISVPQKKGSSQFVGWKKTSVATMQVLVTNKAYDTTNYQTGQIKSITFEEAKTLVV